MHRTSEKLCTKNPTTVNPTCSEQQNRPNREARSPRPRLPHPTPSPCPPAHKGALPFPPSSLFNNQNAETPPSPTALKEPPGAAGRSCPISHVPQGGARHGSSAPALADCLLGRARKELELMISNGILNSYILLFMIMQYFIWVI